MHEARKKAVKCSGLWCDLEFPVLAEKINHKEGCLKGFPHCKKEFNRSDKYSGHLRAHKDMNQRMMECRVGNLIKGGKSNKCSNKCIDSFDNTRRFG